VAKLIDKKTLVTSVVAGLLVFAIREGISRASEREDRQ